MISEYLIGLSLLISVAASLFPSLLETPFSFVLAPFAFQNPFLLAVAGLTFFFFAREIEERKGGVHVAGIWLAGILAAVLLQSQSPSVGGLDALLGAMVAIDPYTVILMELFPIPVIVAVGALIVTKFLLLNSLDIVPLLVGIAYGYALLAVPPAQKQAGFGAGRY